ncbi:MAG: prolipoprotein diacylglyceryl transferase [Candidatus Riflebacteria bacterium]
MHPILWSTPWFNIYSYGLMTALGYSLGTFITVREARRRGLPAEAIFDMLLIQLFVGISGSRLFFLLEYAPEKLNFRDFFAFEQGGLTFYGSLISSFIFDLLYLKFRRIPFWQVMDCIGLAMPVGIAFGRLGCFLNGCCYGTDCSLPWGVIFPAHGQNPVHPTQLYELFTTLLVFFAVKWFMKIQKNHGEAFLVSTVLYSFFRFFIEFYRAENPVVFAGLRLSQLIAIGLIALCVLVRWQIDRSRQLRIMPETGVVDHSPR